MASELTIDYTLTYKISVDVDKMKEHYSWLRDEFDSEEEWMDWMRDSIMADLEEFEEKKLRGESLPGYVTHFSTTERTT